MRQAWLLLFSFLLVSCGPGQIFGPTFTPTPTSTASLTITPTHTFTPTYTSTPVINEYFVSPLGNDSNPGTMNYPFRTIQKGADVAQAGDTVYIRGGTYTDGLIKIKNSGTPEGYLTFKNYLDESVIIDDTWVPDRATRIGMIMILGKSYIRVSGLKLINQPPTIYCSHSPYTCVDGDTNKGYSPRMGFLIEATYTESLNASNQKIATITSPADHIIIENNYIEETFSSGIGVWTGATNITIDGNTVVNADNDHILGKDSSDQEAITIAETNGFEVKNNLVTYNGRLDNHGNPFWGTSGAIAICIKGGRYLNMAIQNGSVHNNRVTNNPVNSGIYVDAEKTPANNIDVYQNYTYRSGNGISVASECGGPVTNVRIFDNLLVYNGMAGVFIAIAASCSDSNFVGDGLKKNIAIFNNTIYGTWKDGGYGIWITSSNIENIQVKNNIVACIPVSQTDINNSVHYDTEGTPFYALFTSQMSMLATDTHTGLPVPADQIFSSNNIVVDKTVYPLFSQRPVLELSGEIIADPQFVKSTIGTEGKVDLPLVYTEDYSDLHLLSMSPAIDAGTNIIDSTLITPVVAPLINFDNNARPQLIGYDIGAYEYLPPATSTPTPTSPFAPTPTFIDTITPTSTPINTSTPTLTCTPTFTPIPTFARTRILIPYILPTDTAESP